MKEFESYYRREQIKEFGHYFNPVLYLLLPVFVFMGILFSKYYHDDNGDLDNYLGEVKGTVTDVNQKQIDLDNPRIRRTVRVETENEDFKIMLDDTLKVGDVIMLDHWKTTTGEDYYGY